MPGQASGGEGGKETSGLMADAAEKAERFTVADAPAERVWSFGIMGSSGSVSDERLSTDSQCAVD